MAVTLGHTYKDRINGFEGVCTGVVQYLTGCNQALLAPKCGPDGAMRASEWFDQQRLDDTGAPAVKLNNGPTPGFDRPAPKR